VTNTLVFIIVDDEKSKTQFVCKPKVAVRPLQGASVSEDDDEKPPNYLAPALPPPVKPKPGISNFCIINRDLDDYQFKRNWLTAVDTK